MYDKTPVYPHQQHLPWAHEPLKSIYVFQRLFTTLLLVPLWVIYYSTLPRSFRPRPSWSIAQIVVVKFTKRIYKVTEVAGVTWGTRDPTLAPNENSLQETRFIWVPPLQPDLCTGIVNDDQVLPRKVGTFVWPKHAPLSARLRCHVKDDGNGILSEHAYSQQKNPSEVHTVGLAFEPDDDIITVSNKPAATYKLPKIDVHEEPIEDAIRNLDVEASAADSPPPVIGLYLHGGGYCHMSAHEKSGTSRIPRRLMKDNLFQEIYAVEYRLLQHAPVPGALQDAAAVYAHLVTHHLGAFKGPDGRYHYPYPNPPKPSHTDIHNSPVPHAVSDTLPPSIGRKISAVPSVSSPTGAGYHPHVEATQGYVDRDNLVEPQISGNDASPHSLVNPVQATTDRIAAARRPRIILIGDSAGGNLVLALARWIRDEGVLPQPDGMLLLSPSCDPSHTLPQVPASRRPRPHANTDYLLDTPEPRALLSRTFLGHHPNAMVYSPYISPASEWVLSVFHGKEEGMADLEPLVPHRDSRDYRDEGIKTYDCAVNGVPVCPDRLSASNNPYIHAPQGMGLFTDFPRAMVVVGDAERLEREVVALERALEHDGVRVRMVWAKDAVHDILIMATWDERVREGIWKEINKWVCEVAAD